MRALNEANRKILAATFGGRKHVTLDIDASVICSKKKQAKRTYKKHRGYTRQCLDTLLRQGKWLLVSFETEMYHRVLAILSFFKKCCQQLPKGVRVNKFRADAASYQRPMINFCMNKEH